MMICPNKKDFWRYPVYRALIPKLMENPQLTLQFMQKEKLWVIGERKIAIKDKQMSKILEMITRLFREIHFLISKAYRVRFFAAKDRIERIYEEAIGREKNDRWVVEEKKEKFPEKEKLARAQLIHLERISVSGKAVLKKTQADGKIHLEKLKEQLAHLKKQKVCWENWLTGQAGEDRYEEAYALLCDVAKQDILSLNRVDWQSMQIELDKKIASKEDEVRKEEEHYKLALDKIDKDLRDTLNRKEAVARVVQKIPNSPLKPVEELAKEVPLHSSTVRVSLFQGDDE